MTTRPTTVPDHPQLDLPGQTHVAQGPHDQTGMYVMHHAFRRDLAAFASSVRAHARSATPTRGRRWAGAGRVSPTPCTTTTTPRTPTTGRCCSPPSRPAAPRPTAPRCTRWATSTPTSTRSWARAPTGSPPWSSTRARSTATPSTSGSPGCARCSTSTCATRRRVVLPLVQRVMTAQEYQAVETAIGKSYPVRDVPFIVGWAMHGLPDGGDGEQMFALAGGGYRLLHAAGPATVRAGRGPSLPLRRRRGPLTVACPASAPEPALEPEVGAALGQPAQVGRHPPGAWRAPRPGRPGRSASSRSPRHGQGEREVAVDRARHDRDPGDGHPTRGAAAAGRPRCGRAARRRGARRRWRAPTTSAVRYQLSTIGWQGANGELGPQRRPPGRRARGRGAAGPARTRWGRPGRTRTSPGPPGPRPRAASIAVT